MFSESRGIYNDIYIIDRDIWGAYEWLQIESRWHNPQMEVYVESHFKHMFGVVPSSLKMLDVGDMGLIWLNWLFHAFPGFTCQLARLRYGR